MQFNFIQFNSCYSSRGGGRFQKCEEPLPPTMLFTYKELRRYTAFFFPDFLHSKPGLAGLSPCWHSGGMLLEKWRANPSGDRLCTFFCPWSLSIHALHVCTFQKRGRCSCLSVARDIALKSTGIARASCIPRMFTALPEFARSLHSHSRKKNFAKSCLLCTFPYPFQCFFTICACVSCLVKNAALVTQRTYPPSGHLLTITFISNYNTLLHTRRIILLLVTLPLC